MDIVNYVNIAYPQNGGLWWKIGIKTNDHSCYCNKLLRQISTFLKIGASDERFSFVTGCSGFMTKPIQANKFKRKNIAQHSTK